MSHSFKVVVIGGESVGKTGLVRKMFKKSIDPNEEPTVSVVAQNLPVTIGSLSTDVTLELYDLPGQERYMILNRMYLRDTNAALIIYDSTRRESMERAEAWIQELKETAPEQAIVAFAGNKLDANNKQVQMAEAQGFARKHDIKIIEQVSAMNGENVDSLVQKIALTCYQNKDSFPSRMRETFKLARNDVNAEEVGGKKKKKGKCC